MGEGSAGPCTLNVSGTNVYGVFMKHKLQRSVVSDLRLGIRGKRTTGKFNAIIVGFQFLFD